MKGLFDTSDPAAQVNKTRANLLATEKTNLNVPDTNKLNDGIDKVKAMKLPEKTESASKKSLDPKAAA